MSDLLRGPLEDTVVFPGRTVTRTVDVGDEDRVLLVPRHESEYAKVGKASRVWGGGRHRGPGRARPRGVGGGAGKGGASCDDGIGGL